MIWHRATASAGDSIFEDVSDIQDLDHKRVSIN
jgi:hypothetical protein